MPANIYDLDSTWTKSRIKSLRLRLGWSQADLARRLQCASTEVESWEKGADIPSPVLMNELFLVAKQAEACSDEVHGSPRAESLCDKKALGQIEFSEIKEDIE